MNLKELFKQINIDLTDLQIKQLNRYYDLLIEKNKVMNLTAITEYDDVLLKHFIDSSLINMVYNIDKCKTLIDVGTGAGFPGLVLKIVFPSIKISLMDSLNKRVNFLNEVINELNLKDIIAIHSRAEDAGVNPKYREKYDVCVSRAVSNLTSLSEYCIPFIKNGGLFISYKADDCENEVNNSLNAINILGCKLDKIESVKLPDSDITRKFIFIRKEKNTPNKFPRKAGLPTKEPLS